MLELEDNDIGINGAEIISIPLKKNKQLRELKLAENLIKTEGAEYILLNGLNLVALDLGKNFIKSSVGPTLRKYVEANRNLRRINLEFNELLAEGAETFFEGAVNSLLEEVNLRGNAIGDRGLARIEHVFNFMDRSMENLKVLNLSSNEITQEGVRSLVTIVNCARLRTLNLSRNLLADEGVIELVDSLRESTAGEILERLDFSGCKVSDKGFMHLVENINSMPELRQLRASDNYVSEKYEKIYVDLLQKNYTLIGLALGGNRLSLSGLKGIRKVVERNLKAFEEREPKKMKSEIMNLKEKQKKIKEAQEKIDRQKREISKLEETKSRLNDNIARLEREEKERKLEYDESLKKRSEQLEQLIENSDNKVEALLKIKNEKERNIEELNNELNRLRDRRKQLEYQLTVAENEEEMIEKEYEKKIKKVK